MNVWNSGVGNRPRPPTRFDDSSPTIIISEVAPWCQDRPRVLPAVSRIEFSPKERTTNVVYCMVLRTTGLWPCGNSVVYQVFWGARFGAVGWGTALLAGVTGIFHWHNPSGRTMALGSTQPLTEMSTRNSSWVGGEGGQCVGLTTLPPSYADCLEIWEPQPPGTLRASLLCFTFLSCSFNSTFAVLIASTLNTVRYVYPEEHSYRKSRSCTSRYHALLNFHPVHKTRFKKRPSKLIGCYIQAKDWRRS